MKIGFIFESGEDGAESQVIKHFVSLAHPEADLHWPPVYNDGKPEMIADCGTDAKTLLDEDKCDRVIIMCDLDSKRHKLLWQDAMEKDIADIRASLAAKGVDEKRVRILLIQEEIETWFVADHRAVSAFLSKRANGRSCSLKRVRGSQDCLNPKKKLTEMFQGKHRPYWDIEHAYGIAKEIDNASRLTHLCSFARFVKLVRDPDFECRRSA